MPDENSNNVPVVTDSQPTTPVVAKGESPVVPSPTDSAVVDVPLESLPASWQEHVKALRKENQTARQAELKRQEDEKLKLDEDAKKKGEWEKLATDREQEVSRLKPLETEVQELNNILLKTFKAEYDKWPDEVKATLPKGDDVTARQVGSWLESHRPLAEKLMQTNAIKPTVRQQGNNAGPNPTTSGNRPAGASEEPLVNVAARL